MLDTARTVLCWVGVVGLALMIWLVVEGALTVRKVRKVVKDLEPTIAHVEQITNALQPAMDRVDPLMERVSLTVDSVNLELMQVDKILSDASSVSGTANDAVQKISNVVNAPSNAFNAAAGKLRKTFGKKEGDRRVEKAIENSGASSLLNGGEPVNMDVERAEFELASDRVSDYMDAEEGENFGTETGSPVKSAATSKTAEAQTEAKDEAQPEAQAEVKAEPQEEHSDDANDDIKDLLEEPEITAASADDSAASQLEKEAKMREEERLAKMEAAADEYFSSPTSE